MSLPAGLSRPLTTHQPPAARPTSSCHSSHVGLGYQTKIQPIFDENSTEIQPHFTLFSTCPQQVFKRKLNQNSTKTQPKLNRTCGKKLAKRLRIKPKLNQNSTKKSAEMYCRSIEGHRYLPQASGVLQLRMAPTASSKNRPSYMIVNGCEASRARMDVMNGSTI